MNMALDTGPLISEEEMNRRRLLLEHRLKEECLKKRKQLYCNLAASLRHFLFLVLATTSILMVISHRTSIERKVSQVIAHIHSNAKNNSLRVNALNREKEIDKINEKEVDQLPN